jgi:hypothetical protein
VRYNGAPELLCVLCCFHVQLLLELFLVLRKSDNGVLAFYGADDFGETLAWNLCVSHVCAKALADVTYLRCSGQASEG